MKTYQEYLDIIKRREWEEGKAAREALQKWQKEHPHIVGVQTDTVSRMISDYSIEIMGMMLEDFLKEFKEILETKKPTSQKMG